MDAVSEDADGGEAYRLRNIASILLHVRGYGEEASKAFVKQNTEFVVDAREG